MCCAENDLSASCYTPTAREFSRAVLFCVTDMMPISDSLLPAALNHLLVQESWARAKLLPHAGKIARFEVGPVTLMLQIAEDALVQAAAAGSAATVTIRVRAADVPLILQHRERAFSYVSIEGDADFANTISQVSQSLRWEVADDLARVTGDIAARRIVDGAGAAVATLRAAQQSIMENLAEYFLDENPMLVRPHAVVDMTADVMRLRDDAERLAKRIGRLS